MKIVIFDLILLSKIQSMLSSASIMPDPLFFAHLCYDEVVRGKHPWAGGELGLLMFESNNFKCVFT